MLILMQDKGLRDFRNTSRNMWKDFHPLITRSLFPIPPIPGIISLVEGMCVCAHMRVCSLLLLSNLFYSQQPG
jgi:hypothetical protein